jgi:hypothetical protein
MKNRVVGITITAVFVIAALTMDVIIPWMLYQGAASSSWPTTDARLESVEWKRRKRKRRLRVRYTYKVEGKSYSATRVTWGLNTSASVSRTYEEGDTASVAYNPSNPSSAVLEPGIKWYDFILLLLPLAFTAIAGVFVRAVMRG